MSIREVSSSKGVSPFWSGALPSKNMNVLIDLSSDTVSYLKDAHSRYMVLVGLYEAKHEMISEKCAEEDRVKFASLIKRHNGLIVTSAEDFAIFAGELYAIPPGICIAWDKKAFYDEHGMTADAMDKKNKRIKEQAIADEAAAAFKQDQASGNETGCPYPADTRANDIWNIEYQYRELAAQGVFDRHDE